MRDGDSSLRGSSVVVDVEYMVDPGFLLREVWICR